MILQLIIFVLLLFFSALFSGSETAFFSLKYYQIVKVKEEDIKKGNQIKKILSKPSKLLSTILLGNMLVNIFMSSLVASLFLRLSHEYSELISILITTFVLLIFGEVTPKLLAVKNPKTFSKRVVSIMMLFENITTPITAIIAWITDLSIKILHLSFGKPSNKIMKTELKDFFISHDDKATLDIYEKQMILNLYEFSDRKAIEIMRPRTEVFTIENSNDIDSIIGKVKETDFSRIPIFEDNFENIIGILYVRDLILVQSKTKGFILSKVLKSAYFVPEYKKVDELFIEFIKKHIHFAVVVDEYGGFSGIITLEDILEEIIGEIKDKEEFEIKIEKKDEKTYIVEGRIELDEFNQQFNVELESDEAETLNGLLLERFGEIPDEGEVIEIKNIKFEMLTVSNNKINKIKVFLK